MSTKTKKPYKLSTVVSELAEKHPDIPIEYADGKTVMVCPPQRWTDDVLAAGSDNVKAAKLLIGDQYDAFVKAGGSASILMAIIQEDAKENLGESSAS